MVTGTALDQTTESVLGAGAAADIAPARSSVPFAGAPVELTVSEPAVTLPASPQPEAETPPIPASQAAVAAEETVREEIPGAAFSPPPVSEQPAPALKLEWPSDLVQIETNPVRLQAMLAKMQEAEPAPRPKRQRPSLPPVSDEPLVQVETRKPAAPDPGVHAQTPGTGEPVSALTT
jgi:ribonuclease E